MTNLMVYYSPQLLVIVATMLTVLAVGEIWRIAHTHRYSIKHKLEEPDWDTIYENS